MFRRKSLLFVFLLAFSVSAWAKKEILILGGGGVPAGVDTMFDSQLKKLGEFSSNADWVPSVVFNGGHVNTDKIIYSIAGDKSKSATTENLNGIIDDFKARIKRGGLGKDDQILITIGSHGAKPESSGLSHKVDSIDGFFDLDSLIELRNMAEEAGVKLAILDFSCYSGNSLNLATDKTCVLSGASSSVGYLNNGELIVNKMKKGMNLEDVFLQAREYPDSLSPGTPQISTEAGLKTYEITSYLSGSMKERTSLDDSLSGNEEICGNKSPAHLRLTGVLKEIEGSYGRRAIQARLRGNGVIAKARKNLEVAMAQYEMQRVKAKQMLLDVELLNVKGCLKIDGIEPICTEIKILEALFQESVLKDSSQVRPDENEAFQQLRSSNNYKQWLAKKEGYNKIRNEIQRQALDVARYEREIYQALYKHYSASSKKPNPCRDFVL